jgi:ubiquinone/menaquinone biosynthesis C-methylase UbiE
MNHKDHVKLIRAGVPGTGGIWADFGSGRGAFSLALAELLGSESQLISVDKKQAALEKAKRSVISRFPGVEHHILAADFSQALDLPVLDGLVVANALHFLQEKDETVRLLSSYLRPGGRFIVVEYNTDRGNHWVPHPFSFTTWLVIAQRCGLQKTHLLASTPSSFLGEFYSAISHVPSTQ